MEQHVLARGVGPVKNLFRRKSKLEKFSFGLKKLMVKNGVKSMSSSDYETEIFITEDGITFKGVRFETESVENMFKGLKNHE